MSTTFGVSLANRIDGGRAVGNLYGVSVYLGGRRGGYVLEPQRDEGLARRIADALTGLVENDHPPCRRWMHLVVDDEGIVRAAFGAWSWFEAAALARRRVARVETVHGFTPAINSRFSERVR